MAGARAHGLECGLATDLAPVLGQVRGAGEGEGAGPEYYRLALLALADLAVEEVVELEAGAGQPPAAGQREGNMASMLNLVRCVTFISISVKRVDIFSLDHRRSLQTDFWIFLAASFFVAVLRKKNYFTESSGEAVELSVQEAATGAFMIRILRVNILSIKLYILKNRYCYLFRFSNSMSTASCKPSSGGESPSPWSPSATRCTAARPSSTTPATPTR